jgi:hypothetical protein
MGAVVLQTDMRMCHSHAKRILEIYEVCLLFFFFYDFHHRYNFPLFQPNLMTKGTFIV